MKVEKFTKAPWALGIPTDFAPFCVDAKCNNDGMRFEVCNVWGVDDDTVACEQSRANTHLIAAAPEMYEVLKKLVAHYNFSEYCKNEIDMVLAKARGEK
jgi:hypothetical protein